MPLNRFYANGANFPASAIPAYPGIGYYSSRDVMRLFKKVKLNSLEFLSVYCARITDTIIICRKIGTVAPCTAF